MIVDQMKMTNDEINQLLSQVNDGNIECANKQTTETGDKRYWNVKASSHSVFQSFIKVVEENVRRYTNLSNPEIYLMLNDISASTAPEGSGGGWHVDSVTKQYKQFMYLTDCTSPECGSFALLCHRFKIFSTIIVVLNRLFVGGSRYGEKSIIILKRMGFKEKAILGKSGFTWFCETNHIHRGLPIKRGKRIMLTAYIFDGNVPQSIKKLVA